MNGITRAWRNFRHRRKFVRVGRLIGSRCYIMPGVTIGDGAVVQAGSLVSRDVGPYEIWVGTPARFLVHRTKNVPAAERERCDRLIAQYGIRRDRYDAAA